ncbi:MAG: FAD binding domain-containing protein [Myxococcales bacterium]|nr:FAD binding domain-containing protein [Myxococcales bacterium]
MTAYLRPRDDQHALELRAAHPDYLVLAGGTDLLVSAHHKRVPGGVLDVAGRFDGVALTDDGVRIGAGTTWRTIATSAELAAGWSILPAAAQEVGALQIQNRGTIGGNLATSSPVGDGLPVLLALDATIELASVRGARAVPYREFCTGYRTTALGADELIVAVTVPRPAPGTYLGWRKVGTRAAQSISKVMAAAAITIADDRIAAVRFGVGAVADRPIRALAAEAAALGQPANAATAVAVAAAVRAAIKPIDDVRSTAIYRLEIAGTLLARFVENAGRG